MMKKKQPKTKFGVLESVKCHMTYSSPPCSLDHGPEELCSTCRRELGHLNAGHSVFSSEIRSVLILSTAIG